MHGACGRYRLGKGRGSGSADSRMMRPNGKLEINVLDMSIVFCLKNILNELLVVELHEVEVEVGHFEVFADVVGILFEIYGKKHGVHEAVFP
jgi:hypothetical protein